MLGLLRTYCWWLVGATLLAGAVGVFLYLGQTGPRSLEAHALETFREHQAAAVTRAAMNITHSLQVVDDTLSHEGLQASAGLTTADTPEALSTALDRFQTAELARLDATLVVHDRQGRVLATRSDLPPKVANSLARRIQALSETARRTDKVIGRCMKCFARMGSIVVSTRLGHGRILSANVPIDTLLERTAARLVEPGQAAVRILDDNDRELHAIATDELGGGTVPLSARAPLVGPADGWTLELLARPTLPLSIRRETTNLLGIAVLGALLVLLAGALGVVVVRRRARERERVGRLMAHQDKLATLGGLTAQVSHELRNVLTLVYGHAELALMEDDGSQAQRECIETVQVGCTQLQALADALRDYSRRDQVYTEARPLSDAVDRAVRLLAPRLKNGPEVKVVVSADPPVVQNRGQLVQVLVNLIGNACDAVESNKTRNDRGQIEIHLWNSGGTAKLAVDDDGPGVADHAREHLFRPFHTTKGEAGTGLGLAVCAGIAQKHGGELRYERAPLGGARFLMELPCQSH